MPTITSYEFGEGVFIRCVGGEFRDGSCKGYAPGDILITTKNGRAAERLDEDISQFGGAQSSYAGAYGTYWEALGQQVPLSEEQFEEMI